MSSKQTSDSKAYKKYTDAKGLVKSKPESAWLGNEEGMRKDQQIRLEQSILFAYDLEDIDLRKLVSGQFDQKFTHEDNYVGYLENFDIITKLSIFSTDTEKREDKELKAEAEKKKEEKKAKSDPRKGDIG